MNISSNIEFITNTLGMPGVSTDYLVTLVEGFLVVHEQESALIRMQVERFKEQYFTRESSRTARKTKQHTRKFIPSVRQALKQCFFHQRYPSNESKMKICNEHGLTMNQVNNWFINARRRSHILPKNALSDK